MDKSEYAPFIDLALVEYPDGQRKISGVLGLSRVESVISQTYNLGDGAFRAIALELWPRAVGRFEGILNSLDFTLHVMNTHMSLLAHGNNRVRMPYPRKVDFTTDL